MASNLDILSFLKADQDARAKEKEEDAEIRAKERQEDREHILAMIKLGVEKEVRAALQPVEERLEQQERVNQELYQKINSLLREVEVMKEGVNLQQEAFPALPGPQAQPYHQVERGDRQQVNKTEEEYICRENLCTSARKVIGFSPIEPRMLKIQMESYGAKDMDEAMLMEVKSYLKCEMKMLPSLIEKLNIMRIFPPARPDWNVLYVEFGSDYEVDTIFSFTKNMDKKDYRVIRWIPKQMYDRFRAVESLAYNLRQEAGLKTRVKIGRADLVLSTRDSTSSVWSNRELPRNLPEIKVGQFTSTSEFQTRQ